MLHVHLQEYDSLALEELRAAVEDSLGWDWDARLKSCSQTPDALLKSVADPDVPALFILDDARHGALDAAVLSLREQNAFHYLVLRLYSLQAALEPRPPYYRLSGFLGRPADKSILRRLLELVYRDSAAARTAYGGFFSLNIRGRGYRLPYAKIVFFESRGKKIVARTEAQEYEFYGSLDEISKAAPDFFLRCHRSYCINGRRIDSANFTERTVTMRDASVLPFSRGFRQELDAWLSAHEGGE